MKILIRKLIFNLKKIEKILNNENFSKIQTEFQWYENINKKMNISF